MKDMVGRQLVRHDPLAINTETLWTRIQTARSEIPQERIYALFDYLPLRSEALVTAHGGFTLY